MSINKQAAQAIDRAMVQLFLDHPFYSSILLKREVVQTRKIPTLGVSFTHLYYNPEFFLSLPQKLQISALAHEALHPALGHLTRLGARDKMLWNIAGDYVINDYLVLDNMPISPEWFHDKKYRGMSADDIYKLLEQEQQDQQQEQQGQSAGGQGEQDAGDGDNGGKQPGQLGFDIDWSGAPKDASEAAAQEAQIKVEMAQAAAMAKAQGKLPGHLKELVDAILEPRVPWAQALAQFFNHIVRNNYSWFPPSTRYLQQGIVLPRLRNVELGELVFIIDTSASMSRAELEQANSEARHVLHTFRPAKTTVIYADTRVQHVETYDSPDVPFKSMAPGRGGTSFRPAFRYLEEKGIQPTAAVYISDGECNDFPKEPQFPVLWVGTGKRWPSNCTPPYGQVITMGIR